MINSQISKTKIESLIVIFILIQSSIWYDGLVNIVPNALFQRWNSLQIGLTIIMLVLCITRKQIIYKVTVFIIIARLFLAFSTYCNGREFSLVVLCRLVCIMLAFEYFEDRFKEIISILMIVFEVMIYYNLILTIQTEPDIYGAFYGAMGYDNGWSPYFIIAYLIAYIYFKLSGRWLRSLLLVVAIHITIFYTMIGSGMVAIIVVDILLLVRIMIKFNVTLFNSYLIYLGVNTSIVFFRIQNLFSYIIVDLLGKDLTLTGRTRDWDNAMTIIPQKLFIGHGNMDQSTELQILGDVFTHNAFLEQLFRGGIIYIVLFILIIIIVSKNTNIRHNDCMNSAICIFSGFWVLAISEVVLDSLMFFCALIILFFLGHHEKVETIENYNI